MNLSEVQKLLDDNGIQHVLTVEDTGAFCLLTIPNPNHSKNIEIIFKDASDNPEFYDLEFGGYWYEMFDCPDDILSRELIDEIQSILLGRVWVIFATNAKNGAWFFDGIFRDTVEEEWNDMDELQETIRKIKEPKSLWRKLFKRTDCYEIFNWKKHEKIIK